MDVTDYRQIASAHATANLGARAAFTDGGVVVDLGTVAGELGGEIAAPLTAALARVDTLTSTGHIDRAGLAALRSEIEGARRAGIIGQQLGRLAGGRIRQDPQTLDLPQLLRQAVLERAREIQQRGIEVRQSLHPAHVIADESLVYSLLDALLDWSLPLSHERVLMTIDVKSWPVQARLICRFAHRAADEVHADTPAGAPHLDTMAWRLVQQTASAMGLQVTREDSASETRLTVEFPRTVNEQVAGLSVIEFDDDNSRLPDSRPVAGSHILVLSARREMRTLVREAIRPMGLMVDFTGSVDEAREFCRNGLPHGLIYEAALGGERFEQLRSELLTQAPTLAFIAIGEDGRDYESTLRDGHQITRVGRDAVMTSLPSALLFELSRGLPN